jgi:hypothetical protein
MKMKWLPAACVAVVSGLAATSTAAAADFQCAGTFTGQTFAKIVVPDNAVCTLVGSTVTGDVKVMENAYFEANATSIQGSVKGSKALTIYAHDGSTIGKDVNVKQTSQLFLFDGDVDGNVQAKSSIQSFGHVQICGMDIGRNVNVQKGGTDILVGDTLAGCGGNSVGGNVLIQNNFTDVELVVRDNSISGKLTVSKNVGPSDKFVQGNTGSGKNIQCKNNGGPFAGSPNSGFVVKPGDQCTT